MSDISILPDPFDCPDCGHVCEPVVTYDPELRERVDAWHCPRCDCRYYRESGPEGSVLLRGVARLLRRGRR